MTPVSQLHCSSFVVGGCLCVHHSRIRTKLPGKSATQLPPKNHLPKNPTHLSGRTRTGFLKHAGHFLSISRGPRCITSPGLMSGVANAMRQGASSRRLISSGRFCGANRVGPGLPPPWTAAPHRGGSISSAPAIAHSPTNKDESYGTRNLLRPMQRSDQNS